MITYDYYKPMQIVASVCVGLTPVLNYNVTFSFVKTARYGRFFFSFSRLSPLGLVNLPPIRYNEAAHFLIKEYSPAMNQLICQIDRLLARQTQVIVAIDGFCTSGKTTLAARLAEHYDCCVVHMDDFFLRPEQRTPERLAQPGGNVDYERFQEEVLLPLKTGLPFSYRPYDCGSRTLSQPVFVEPKRLTVIEGTYSHHPHFGAYCDLRVFLTVSPDVQHQRILQRPAFLHRRFFEEWIPMEHLYFDRFSIPAKADMVIDPTLVF